MYTRLLNTLAAAIFSVIAVKEINTLNQSFTHEETMQVAVFMHEELKGTGPYLVNGVSIDPDNIVNILEEMDELYKIFSIAISSTYTGQIAKRASTRNFQIGPLGVLEEALSSFKTISDTKVLGDGSRVATILILNPDVPDEQKKLKNLLKQHSAAYAFSANTTGRPFFQEGEFRVK